MIRILTDYQEQKHWIEPIMKSLGSGIPDEGRGVIVTEFDDKGVVAFQIFQDILIAEGMWARDGSAHLRTLWSKGIEFVQSLGAQGKTLFTMTRGDEQGQRIGKCVERMGFQKTNWNVYKRTI